MVIHYQIHAFRNEHVKQFFDMTRYFKDVGFVRADDDVPPDDEPENSDYDRMHGTIPADKAPLLLGERHVRVIQLPPQGKKLPDDANALVRVDLELESGYAPEGGSVRCRSGRRGYCGPEVPGGGRLRPARRYASAGAIPAGQVPALLGDVHPAWRSAHGADSIGVADPRGQRLAAGRAAVPSGAARAAGRAEGSGKGQRRSCAAAGQGRSGEPGSDSYVHARRR